MNCISHLCCNSEKVRLFIEYNPHKSTKSNRIMMPVALAASLVLARPPTRGCDAWTQSHRKLAAGGTYIPLGWSSGPTSAPCTPRVFPWSSYRWAFPGRCLSARACTREPGSRRVAEPSPLPFLHCWCLYKVLESTALQVPLTTWEMLVLTSSRISVVPQARLYWSRATCAWAWSPTTCGSGCHSFRHLCVSLKLK